MGSEQIPMNKARRYAHIDALRAYAVLIVVISHAGLGHVVPGGSGVTLFFAISGFIITFLLLKERDRTGKFDWRGFYFRRAMKIFPPLIAIVALPTLTYSFWHQINWQDFAGQIFFLFNWLVLDGHVKVMPGTFPVWSLSIEEQFYLGFAIFWLWAVRLGPWKAITAWVAMATILASLSLRFLLIGSSERIYFGTDTRIEGIAWGVLLAIAYHHWLTTEKVRSEIVSLLGSNWSLVAALIFYVCSLLVRDDWFRDTFRYTLQALSGCLMIAYGLLPGTGKIRNCFVAISRNPVISLIGMSSYSIYLIHMILNELISPLILTWMPIFQVLLLSGVGVVGGIVVYVTVEKYFHGLGRKGRMRSPAARKT